MSDDVKPPASRWRATDLDGGWRFVFGGVWWMPTRIQGMAARRDPLDGGSPQYPTGCVVQATMVPAGHVPTPAGDGWVVPDGESRWFRFGTAAALRAVPPPVVA